MKEITNLALPTKRKREIDQKTKPWYENQLIKRQKKTFFDKIGKSNITKWEHYDVHYTGSVVITDKHGEVVECSSSSENAENCQDCILNNS